MFPLILTVLNRDYSRVGTKNPIKECPRLDVQGCRTVSERKLRKCLAATEFLVQTRNGMQGLKRCHACFKVSLIPTTSGRDGGLYEAAEVWEHLDRVVLPSGRCWQSVLHRNGAAANGLLVFGMPFPESPMVQLHSLVVVAWTVT